MKNTELFSKVWNYITENQLFDTEKKLLLSYSSGPDSVFLAEFLLHSGISFDIAHVNYHMRRDDSEKDQNFALDFAHKRNLECHITHFHFDKEKDGNFQNWAREARYSWLKDLQKKFGYDAILTAHHLNDQFESFLMNLLRGSGLRGLRGMSNSVGKVKRPLLVLLKEEILEYLERNKINYRVDRSNSSLKYKRNEIRHNIMPLLQSLSPEYLSNFAYSQHFIEEAWRLIEENAKAHSFEFDIAYKLEDIRSQTKLSSALSEQLRDLEFSRDQIFRILNSKEILSESKIFESRKARIEISRSILRLTDRNVQKAYHYTTKISEGEHHMGKYMLEVQQVKNSFFSVDKRVECIPVRVLKSGFQIRTWKKGDVMKPFGMKGRTKKIQDLFTDLKFDNYRKRNALLLLNHKNEILWVLGERLSDLARIKPSDNEFYELRLWLTEGNEP